MQQLSNPEVNDQSDNVIGSGDERAGGQCRVDTEAIQCKWDVRSRYTGKYDDTEQCDTGCNAHAQVKVEQLCSEEDE